MKKLSRNAKIVIFCVIFAAVSVLVIMLNQFLRQHNQERKEERQRYEQMIDGDLRHEAVGLKSSDTVYDLTGEEIDKIFDTLQIVIPDDETEITVRLVSKEDVGTSGAYYFEFDGIKDRDDFVAANADRHDSLDLGALWNMTDDDGNYKYYFGFFVYYKSKILQVEKNEYITRVGELYNELLAARS